MAPWERRNYLEAKEDAGMPEREYLVFGEFYSHEADATGFKDMRWLSADTLLALFENSVLQEALETFRSNVSTACEEVCAAEAQPDQ